MILNELLAPGEKKPLTFRSDRRALDKSSSDKIMQIYDPIIQHIFTDCSRFLEEIKGTKCLCYHGYNDVRKNNSPIFMGKSMNDRRSRDSSTLSTMIFNNALSKIGIKANRSNSLFVVSDYIAAKGYGNKVYVIFPKNTSDYCWTKYQDLILPGVSYLPVDNKIDYSDEYKLLIKMASALPESIEKENLLEKIKELPEKNLEEILETLKYDIKWEETGADLLEKSGMDELLNEENPKLIKYFPMDTASFVEKYQPKNTDLQTALIRAVEIYIHGEYIAIEVSMYENLRKYYPELPTE